MNELIAFKEFPKELKPRERLVEYGAKTLTNHELLAIILRTGTKQYDVLHLALQVLEHFEDMHSLKACRVEELLQLKGIGFAKAVELLAAIEFGTRVGRSTQIKKGTVTSSQWIGNALVDELGGLHQEHVVALYLNTKNEIIQKETVFKGSLNTAVSRMKNVKNLNGHKPRRCQLLHGRPLRQLTLIWFLFLLFSSQNSLINLFFLLVRFLPIL